MRLIEKYSLFTPEKAEQSLRFIEANRSYIINYNLGKDLVAKHIELQGGSYSNPEVVLPPSFRIVRGGYLALGLGHLFRGKIV